MIFDCFFKNSEWYVLLSLIVKVYIWPRTNLWIDVDHGVRSVHVLLKCPGFNEIAGSSVRWVSIIKN